MSTRLEKLTTQLPANIECMIITSGYSRYYFTGMRSSAGTLLVTREKSYFIIDFRYIELAKKTVKNAEVILQGKLYEQITEIFERHGVQTAAVETSYLTVGEFARMQEKLPNVTLTMDNTADKMILDLRAHKDKTELKAICRAQEITDKGFAYICGYIKEGMTEKEIALELEHYMLSLGAEKLSFDTICVSGVNTSLPHGVPSDKKVEKGDFITMDFGVVIDGYCSDMTRTVALGYVTDEMKKVYETVLAAHLASRDAIKVGTPNKDIDAAARSLIYAAGYEGCFGHGLGHSVGLEIHEDPRYSTAGEGVCEVGHVMTIEPGIYLEGKFGVRIENMIYIDEGEIIDLTQSPRELIII